jgi:hypothetical protein
MSVRLWEPLTPPILSRRGSPVDPLPVGIGHLGEGWNRS